MLLDKKGFAYLRKGDLFTAIDLYNRSLEINRENNTAIKNLSYLYASTGNRDTAVVLLSEGIRREPSDMDLYIRRAQIYYSMNYTKRALDDYLVLLAAGDSSAFNLKRAGIGYSNNLQPAIALRYLHKSYIKDSSDYETNSYMGQAYYNLEDMKKSIYYYNKVLKLLSPVNLQTGLTYILLAGSQKQDGRYNEAIASYLKSQEFKVDPNIYMIIANIYDEQLENKPKAIQHYQLFLNTMAKSKTAFSAEYVDAIKKRVEYLKEEQKK
jgi:tetratricopeptide (TPR) repeat protein